MPVVSRVTVACSAVLIALASTACGGSAPTPDAGTPAARAPARGRSTSAPTGDAGSTGAATAPSGTAVSANTASVDEIAAALESAGVSNAERWAEEVVEYRPYPPDDPDLTKLRDNLAKYNPGEETTDLIVSALTP